MYVTFHILNSSTNYTLNVGGYSGRAGDSFTRHNSRQFSTKDRENNSFCANRYNGAWWYADCHSSNLNGLYHGGCHTDGVNWRTWRGYYYSLRLLK